MAKPCQPPVREWHAVACVSKDYQRSAFKGLRIARSDACLDAAPHALRRVTKPVTHAKRLVSKYLSMLDKPKLLKEMIQAIAGRRALFYAGWSGVDATMLPTNFLVIDETPHDWLFPRTSLVVHHGGSGTTHSAARAGIPSVVVPFAADQFFWADRLRQAGVAANALRWKHLDADQLSSRMEFARTDGVVVRARALGEKMRAEKGLLNAVAFIEKIMLD